MGLGVLTVVSARVQNSFPHTSAALVACPGSAGTRAPICGPNMVVSSPVWRQRGFQETRVQAAGFVVSDLT